ncbi:MAG: hypothetical protein AAF447_08570 [Myxococcota bacterium]
MRSLLATLASVHLLAGCGGGEPLPDRMRVDFGPADQGADAPDLRPPPGQDSDGDGLCDDYERVFRLDPNDPDTDGDDFPDYWETVIRDLDPFDRATPEIERVAFVRETPLGAAQVPVQLTVSGEGEDYTGAFESFQAVDEFNEDAGDYYAESLPVFAVPEENVGLLDAERESFRGVIGRTLLGFEVRLAFGGNTARRCHRVYHWRYNVKRSDGAAVASERFHLVVLAEGESLSSGDFCAPPIDSCLGAPPGADIP